MDQDALTDGKVYVFGIKNTSKRDFKAHNIVYRIGCENNDGVSLAKFREICEAKITKLCYLRKLMFTMMNVVPGGRFAQPWMKSLLLGHLKLN